MRETFVFKDGQFVSKRTGYPLAYDSSAPICTPFVAADIPEYHSPIDGRLITSRSHRREDLKRNNCVEWEPGIGKKAELKNPRLAKKYGIPLNVA